MIKYREIPRKKHQILLDSAIGSLQKLYYGKILKLPLRKIGITAGCAAVLLGGAVMMWPSDVPVPPEQVVELIGKMNTPTLHPDRPYVQELQKLITRIAGGSSVNTTDSEDNTALILAARLKNRPALCWLLAKGADVHCKNDAGLTARDYIEDETLYTLLSICMSEKDELSDTARAAFAMTTTESKSHLRGDLTPDRLRECALQIKAGGDATQMAADVMPLGSGADVYLAYLIRHGADIPQARRLVERDRMNLPVEITAYLQALGVDTEALVPRTPEEPELLPPDDPTARDSKGNTALINAVLAHDVERVQRLIEVGAEVNIRNNQGYTPLLLAIDNCTADNGPEIVRRLIAAGADMEAQRNEENAITQFVLNAGALATKPGFERHLPALEQTLQHMIDARAYLRPHLLLLLPKAEPGVKISPLLAKFAERLIDAGVNVKLESFGILNGGALATVGCCDAALAQKLIDMGAPVNVRSGNGATPLMGAQNAEIARVFINAGAQINAADNAGRTALHYAIAEQDFERVKLLLEHGAEVNCADSTGASPLLTAVSSSTGEEGFNIVRSLLNAGADVKVKDRNNRTALHLAIIAQDPPLTKLLLGAGADVNAVDSQRYTPLLSAVELSSTSMHGEGAEIVSLLLDAGANTNITRQDARGNQSPYTLTLRRLSYDVQRTGYAERIVPAMHRVLKVMLDKGVPIAEHSGSLMPAGMHEIVLPSELTDIAELLINGKLFVNSINYSFTTLMCMGSLHPKITRELLERGADPKVRAPRNWTTLHSAQTPEVAQALLEAGVDPNIASDWDGRGTPLRNAVRIAPENILADMAETLVKGGAKVKGPDWDILRDLSQRELSFKTFSKLAKFFIEHGADINTAWGGLYPAEVLIPLGAEVKKDMLLTPAYARDAEALVKAGADINARDAEGNTPLHKLLIAGNEIVDRFDMDAVVKLYLNLGADPNIKNNIGALPSMLARRGALLAALHNGLDASMRIGPIIRAYHNYYYQENLPDKVRLEALRIMLIEQRHPLPERAFVELTQPELVDFMLEAGANPNETAQNGDTPLMRLALNRPMYTEKLLKAGADPKLSNNEGNTALHLTTNPEALQMLLQAGADINARNKAGRTPLAEALARRNIALSRTLLEAGAQVKGSGAIGALASCPDFPGSQQALVYHLKELIKAGGDINEAWEASPIFRSLVNAKVMLELGADPHWKTADGRTTLMLRGGGSNALCPAGVDINATDNQGNTALMYMVQEDYDFSRIVAEFARWGADFTIRNKEGLTALDFARRGKYADRAVPALQRYYSYTWKKPAVEDIICPAAPGADELRDRIRRIQNGESVNAADAAGQTPLMLAIKGKNRLAACWLIAKGADVTLKDNEGKTAGDMAHTIAMRELLTLCAHEKEPLTDKEKADLNSRADTPEKMEKTLAEYGRYAAKLSILLKGGADPAKPAKDGSLLVEHDMQLESLAYLLRRGYDPNTRRADGKLPARNFRPHDTSDMAPEYLRLLLAMGMQPDAHDKYATLCAALTCNDVKSVQELLRQEDSLIRSKTPAGAPLLTLASSGEMVRALVAAGADAKENGLLNRFTGASADAVKALLEAGATIPAAKPGEESLLHKVTNAELVPVLVQAGADVNHRSYQDSTPLFDAVFGYQADKVEALIKAGADVNAKRSNGHTALTYRFGTVRFMTTSRIGSWVSSYDYPESRAARENKANMGRVLELLLDAKAQATDDVWYGVINKFPEDSDTVTDDIKQGMILALFKHKIPMPKDILAHLPANPFYDSLSRELRDWLATKLLDAGADPKATAKDTEYNEDITTLIAAGRYSAAIVKRLIAGGANPKAVTCIGRTALHEACTLEALEALLAAGAPVNTYCTEGSFEGPPICKIVARAEEADLVPMIKRLFKAGAKACSKAGEKDSWDAMRSLGERHNYSPAVYLEAGKLLVQAGADPNQAFSTWCWDRYIPELAQLGVDFTRSGKPEGGTILHTLPRWLTEDTLSKLLLIGVDINAVNNNGDTVLMLASAEGNENTVRLLLQFGADASIKNKAGKTAQDLAKEKRRNTIAELLEQYAQSPAPANIPRLLGLASAKPGSPEGRLAALISAVLYGSDDDARRKDLQAALLLAAQQENTLAVCWLLAKGADPDLKDAGGKTARDMTSDFATLRAINQATADLSPQKAQDTANSIASPWGLSPANLANRVRSGYDVNTEPSGNTPLLRSSRTEDTMKLLLALGHRPKAQDAAQNLLAALYNDDVAYVKRALDKDKGLISQQDPKAPLLLAAQSAEAAQALIAAGADAKAMIDDTSLLSHILHAGVAQEMIKVGAKLAPKDTPLHSCPAEMVELFVKAGADPNAQDKRGDTPLVSAGLHGNIALLTALIDNGADVNLPNKHGLTPLARAASVCDPRALELLISRGVDVNKPVINRIPAVSWIFRSPYENGRPVEMELRMAETLKVFIKHKAKLTQECPFYPDAPETVKESTNLLRQALAHFDMTAEPNDARPWQETIHLIINQYGKNVPSDALLYIPAPMDIHLFSRKEWADIATRLLDAGADPKAVYHSADHPDAPYYYTRKDGLTTLMTAGGFDIALTQRLLNAGVDPKAKTTEGYTALHSARTAAVAEALIKAGADIEAEFYRDRPIQMMIMHADSKEISALIRYMIKAGAQVKGDNWDLMKTLNSHKEEIGSAAYEEIKALISK